MKTNRKYLNKRSGEEYLKEGMSKLDIMKYNKALYSRLEKALNNLPDGLKKYVIKYYSLPWCKNNNWLGGMSDSASNKAIYKILSLGDYTEDEIMDEMDNFIDCFNPYNSNKSEDEKIKLYLNEALNEDLFDKPRNIADSICKYLDSKNFYNYELVDYDSYPMNTSKITFEVDGDWKHDHWRFKDLVYDWSFDNNKSIYKIESELVRDDGSDDYASDYFIYVTENEDSLKELKSMSGLFSESVVYPNGMPASDIDIHDALNFNFGLDRDMNDDNYTDEEKQRSIDYWIKKIDGMHEDLNLDDFMEPIDQVGKTKIYYDPNKRTYFIPSLDLDFETIDQAKDFIGAPLYTGESLNEEFITAQDVEEARRALKNPKKLSLEQVKNLQNLIKKYKEQESSRKSSKNESLDEASYGGAYDIEDDMYFTKEELVEFAGDIAEEFSTLTGHMNCDVDNVYMENNPLALNVDIYDPEDGVSHSAYTRIDMRKIRKPSDIYKYMDRILKQLEDSFHEYHENDFEDAD